MADVLVPQVVLEIARTEEDTVRLSQVIVEIARTLEEHALVSQVCIEVGFIRTGRYAGPAVQHI